MGEWEGNIPVKQSFQMPQPRIPNAATILDAAAAKTSNIDETNFGDGIAEEPETWFEPFARFIWDLAIDHGIKIALILCGYSLVSIIVRKLYLQNIVTFFKSCLNYIGLLKEMRDLLEDEYELELWSQPEFCKKYLELFDEFRHMRSIANRDHKGNSLIDDRKRQEEAKPLIPFFDTDYELHDRLIYALDGVEWTGADEDEEQFDISRQQEQQRRELDLQQASSGTSDEGIKKRILTSNEKEAR